MAWNKVVSSTVVPYGKKVRFRGSCGHCPEKATSVDYDVPSRDPDYQKHVVPDPEDDLDVVLTCDKCEWEDSIVLGPPDSGGFKIGNPAGIQDLEYEILN